MRVLSTRLDLLREAVEGVGRKVDKLDSAVMDHEVRIRVMEKVGA
jgi:hypothetical protein